MRQSSSGKEHNLSLRLVLFFPFPLLFSWLSAYLFIEREIQEAIPLQFPGCFSVFLREILFEKTFSCWMSAKLSQSESAASCKRLYIRPEFWRECYTPLRWLDVSFFSHLKKHRSLLWLARTHLRMRNLWWVFLSMYIIKLYSHLFS